MTFHSSIGSTQSGPRVLVVDDEPSVGRAMERVLRDFRVTFAQSATGALGRIQGSTEFVAVISDVLMPGMSGLELYGELKRIAPGLAASLVLVTGATDNPELEALVRRENVRVVHKPFEAEALRHVVWQAARAAQPDHRRPGVLVGWSPALAIGHPLIDAQHRELVERLDSLHQAMLRGEHDETARLLAHLDSYVTEHFATEERFMREVRYPDYAQHKAEHDGFTRDYHEIRRLFGERGPTASLLVRAKELVAGWARRHIRSTDIAMGAFLRQQQEGRRRGSSDRV